jgi:hypothetical protein
MGVFNVWNHEEIDNLLSGLAEGDEFPSQDGEIFLGHFISPVYRAFLPEAGQRGVRIMAL